MAVMIEGRALWSSGDCAIDSKQAPSHILPPPEGAGLLACELHRSKRNNPNLDLSDVFVLFVLFCFLSERPCRGKDLKAAMFDGIITQTRKRSKVMRWGSGRGAAEVLHVCVLWTLITCRLPVRDCQCLGVRAQHGGLDRG